MLKKGSILKKLILVHLFLCVNPLTPSYASWNYDNHNRVATQPGKPGESGKVREFDI